MNNKYNTTDATVRLESCNHNVNVDVVNGLIITYCSKCGEILDTKPVKVHYSLGE